MAYAVTVVRKEDPEEVLLSALVATKAKADELAAPYKAGDACIVTITKQ